MDIAGKNVLVFGSGISGIGAAGLLEERGRPCNQSSIREGIAEGGKGSAEPVWRLC